MEAVLTIIYGISAVYSLAGLIIQKIFNYRASSEFVLLLMIFSLTAIVYQQIAMAYIGVGSDHLSLLNRLFKKVEGSVVQITSKMPIASSNDTQQPGGENRTALGSGFVYDRQGHIVTNSHVVGDAKSVDVTSIDGNRYTANVTGRDPYSDLAVLKVLNPNSNNTQKSQFLLDSLTLGNSSELEVGDPVIAIGNPYGLDNTMTTGIVSQVGRAVQAPVGGYSIPDVVQTDAALNPGNSGGPLFNIRSQVVGVTFGGIPGGINFAIPSDIVRHIIPVLIDKGNYTHPYLGIKVASLTSDLTSQVGNLPLNLRGVFVDTILRGGSADKAGIKGSTTDQYGKKHGGDIITAIDGKNITRSEDMISYLEKTKSPGNPVSFTIYRDGHFIRLETTVGSRPSIK